MRSLRVLVTLLLLVTQFRPVAAALACLYEEQAAAVACGSDMGETGAAGHEHGVASRAAASAGGVLTATPAADRLDCGLATVCAAPAPALLLSRVSLVAPFALVDASAPGLPLLSPGERAAPPTQPPRV